MLKKLFEFNKLKNVSNIAILGLLLSLRIILQFVGSIPLGPTTLSFTWITLVVTGFIFGPFIGLMFGTIADLLGYALHPGIFMWEYSIQEPLICMVAGFIGFIYFNYKSKKWVDFIVFEIFLVAFTTVALVVALMEHPNITKAVIGSKTREHSTSFLDNKILPLILVPIFFVLINIVVLYLIIGNKSNYRIILYVAIIVIQAWVVWSWIEGPWAQIRYWKRKGWKSVLDSNKVELTKRWLFNVRVFKASFVVPIEIFVVSSIMMVYQKLPINQNGY